MSEARPHRRRARLGWWSLACAGAVACASEHAPTRLVLVEVEVADVQEAVTFYRAVFGWEVSYPDSSYALLDAQPVPIGLVRAEGGAPRRTGIVISVDDLDAALARVEENGGTVLSPVGAAWRGREFSFADPDGNELVAWSEDEVPRVGSER